MFSSKLNNVFVVFVFVFFAFLLSGCKTATVMSTTASDSSSLSAESMQVWSRPLETGFTAMGMGEGRAKSNDERKAISGSTGFFLAGSVPSSSLTPVAQLAAFNAIKEANADGMYVTMVQEEEDLNSEKTVWVKGVMLKLVFYDTVSPQRSDAVRFCTKGCMKSDCCIKECGGIDFGK